MEIIIPASGLSTRFPNSDPKYLLEDQRGRLMIELSIESIQRSLPRARVHITVLKEHDQLYNAVARLKSRPCCATATITVLDQRTRGAADTVYQTIVKNQIDPQSPLLIKDCDNFAVYQDVVEENAIWTASLKDYPFLNFAANKSYVISNSNDLVVNIVEKQVVSERFVSGCYQFSTAAAFCNHYLAVEKFSTNEIFVSTVIADMLLNKHIFKDKHVKDFIDVGTIEDWNTYNTDRPLTKTPL